MPGASKVAVDKVATAYGASDATALKERERAQKPPAYQVTNVNS